MEYHKINSLFKRDPHDKRLLFGEYSEPEYEYLQHNVWLYSEKIDGTNIRVIVKDGRITFGGRTANAAIPAKLMNRLNERFSGANAERLLGYPDGSILFGEGYGPGIQAGGNYRADQDFVLFDVLINGWWLQRSNVEDVARQFDLEVVPIVGTGTLDDLVKVTSEGFASFRGTAKAEGIVARPAVELQTRAGERIITKLKLRDFSPSKTKAVATGGHQ